MAKSAVSGDGLHLDNGVVMWFDTFEYLGIHFRCGKRLQVDIDPIKKHFNAADNSIFTNAAHFIEEAYSFSSMGICSRIY